MSYLDFLRLVFDYGLMVPQVSLKLFVSLQKSLAQLSSQLEVWKKKVKKISRRIQLQSFAQMHLGVWQDVPKLKLETTRVELLKGECMAFSADQGS